MLAPVTVVTATSPGAPPRVRAQATRVLLRYAGIAALALLVGGVHLRNRPPTLCLLRATTGVPCPFCGGTTAVSDLGHGDLGAAVAASPLAVLLAVGLPVIGIAPKPRWWANRRLRVTAVVTVLVLAWIWQLARFGLLPV